MSNTRVLVLGGIRSGKSAFAESLLASAEQATYLATAAAVPDDAAWSARIAAHRDRRPAAWATEEFAADPYGLALRLSGAKPGESLLVDDLGGWLTAVLDTVGWSDPTTANDAVAALVDGLADSAAEVVLVSPEVGLSVVPATESGRTFADALGRLNSTLAAAADQVVLVVAGQAVTLKPQTLTSEGYGPRLPQPAASSAPPAPVSVTKPEPDPAPAVGVAAAPSTVDTTGAPDFTQHLDLRIPDEASASAATERLPTLDFAGAGLGTLDAVVHLAAGTQDRAIPRPWANPRLILLHGIHAGLAGDGDDPATVARHLAQVHDGTGALALLAAGAGAAMSTVDCLPAAPMEDADALSEDEVIEALSTGWRQAETAVDEGTDVIVLGALSIGAEAAAVAVAALTSGGEPAALLDRVTVAGGTIDDNAWMGRCLAVRNALQRVRTRPRDPRSLLAMVGGGDIAVATGVILGATFRHTPVLVDGPVGIAAALVARDLAPQTRHWLFLPDNGAHPLVRFAGDVLGLTGLLHLKLRLGEGATALAAFPVLNAALHLAAGIPATPAPSPG